MKTSPYIQSKQSVDSFKIEILDKILSKDLDIALTDGDSRGMRQRVTDNLTSSHISLLQSVVEMVKGMFVEATDSDNGYQTGVTMNRRRLTHKQMEGYNIAVEEFTKNLEEEINLCKKQ